MTKSERDTSEPEKVLFAAFYGVTMTGGMRAED